ncbi:MAG: VWA domain-containing protein [Bacteroidia bacterium]
MATIPILFAQKKNIILDHKNQVRISPLHTLNSRYRETNLSITPDGRYLYFMTVRGQQPWSSQTMNYKDMQIYDGDIWFSEKMSGKWGQPKCLPPGINTSNGEDEPNVSPDGKTVYFQSWKNTWQIDGGPYYAASLKSGKWGQPQGLGGGITQFFDETGINATDGMAISPDGKIFVVACGRDYNGAMDLYISRKRGNKWSYLTKMPVNTKGNERSAFIAADGKTLYFASDGYNGYGGLDIYKTEIRDDGTYGEVINVGTPFNTTKDDYGLILTGDGNEAYFIRADDIYFADISKADESMKPNVEQFLEVNVTDRENKRGITATVSVIDMKTQKVIGKERANNRGKFRLKLPNEDKNYQITIIADGYDKAEPKVVKVKKAFANKAYTEEVKLQKIKPVVKPVPPKQPMIAEVQPPTPPIQPIDTVIPTPPVVIPPSPPLPDPVIAWAKENPVWGLRPKVAPPIKASRNEKDANTMGLLETDPYSYDDVAENNLILLMDVSGSMNSRDKLQLLKTSFLDLIQYMRKEDKVTAISFAGKTKVLVEDVSARDKDLLKNRLQSLGRGGGSTKAKPALQKAYKLAKKNYIPGGNNRIILATDGGPEAEKLYALARKLAKKDIYLTVFVFGKMSEAEQETFRELAQKGNGNLYLVNRENMTEVLLQETKAIRKK